MAAGEIPMRASSRRLLMLLMTAFICVLSFWSSFAAEPVGTLGMGGKLMINERGKAKIHTIMVSPLASTVHIIETTEGLVIIDAQQSYRGLGR
jgi:hypothetical protein